MRTLVPPSQSGSTSLDFEGFKFVQLLPLTRLHQRAIAQSRLSAEQDGLHGGVKNHTDRSPHTAAEPRLKDNVSI